MWTEERQVNRALAALNITRVVIAHRPETIRAADRIVALEGGTLRCSTLPVGSQLDDANIASVRYRIARKSRVPNKKRKKISLAAVQTG